MKTTIVATVYLFLSLCLFGQVKSFQDIPKELLEQLNEMGKDDSPVLNEHESDYYNVIFEKIRKDFNFKNKKVGFITGSNGKTLSSKKKYFELEKYRFTQNYTPNNGNLYIFSTAQKEESGDYDAVIVYWSKVLISTEEIIQRLKKNRKK